MKNMKKILALVVAVLMIVASMSAFAATNEYTITVTNPSTSNLSIVGKTFYAHKLFDLVFSGENYSYTIKKTNAFFASEEAKSILDGYFDFTAIASDDTAMTVTVKEVKQDANKTLSAADVRALADALQPYIPTTSELKATATGESVTIDVGEAGYYLVSGEGKDSEGGAVVSAIMIDNADKTGEITLKADAPTLDKKINGTADTDNDTTGEVDANHVNIGDDVPYILKSKVPDMTGYTGYWFVVKDHLSKGLTYKAPVAITIGETSLDSDNFDVTTDVGPDGTDIEIVIKNFINYKEQAGDNITITYKATLNENAVVGDAGNPNTAKLIYSNNPYEDYDGDKPGPNDDNLVNETPDSEVKTYTTGIKVLKVNGSDEKLEGATFELKGLLNAVEVTTVENKFVADPAGDYWKLMDGTYTKKDPASIPSDAANRAELLNLYDNDTSTKYKKTASHTTATSSGTANATVSATTGEAGVITFDGLTHGTYTLTETEAPEGYNKLETPIEFEVKFVSGKWAVESKTDGYNVELKSDGTFEISILNQSGTQLPSTGGMGTTILYIGGSILVLAAAILLITKRRMSSED